MTLRGQYAGGVVTLRDRTPFAAGRLGPVDGCVGTVQHARDVVTGVHERRPGAGGHPAVGARPGHPDPQAVGEGGVVGGPGRAGRPPATTVTGVTEAGSVPSCSRSDRLPLLRVPGPRPG